MLDFLIFYEVGVREFESISLLGYELRKRGYSVEYLGFEESDYNKYIKNRKLLKRYYNNVDTVIMPSLYNNEEIYNSVYYICGKCAHIVNLRWEQYFENYVMEDMESVCFPQKLAKKAYHLCWGSVSRDSLSGRGIDNRFIPVTGAIHTDFLRREFRDFYQDRESLFREYSLDAKKQTVLYISSFVTATMTERFKEKVKNDFNGEYEFRDDTYEFHRKSYEIMIDWIEEFLKKNEDVQFIYRPHPAENLTDYITKLEKYDNFFIVSDKSVKQWVMTCDTITTWVSTSIVEAYFAEKTVYIVRPIPYPDDMDICIYRGAKYIESFDDFMNVTSAGSVSSIEKDVIEEYYSFEEKPAYLRTADFLESVRSDAEKFPWDQKLADNFDRKRKKLFQRNVLFIVYYRLVVIAMKIQDKTGLKYIPEIQRRVDNIRTLTKAKRGSGEPLESVIRRVETYMNGLETK